LHAPASPASLRAAPLGPKPAFPGG